MNPIQWRESAVLKKTWGSLQDTFPLRLLVVCLISLGVLGELVLCRVKAGTSLEAAICFNKNVFQYNIVYLKIIFR